MSDEHEKFNHTENVKNFTLRLAVKTDFRMREVLTMLFAEEIARLSAAAKRH